MKRAVTLLDDHGKQIVQNRIEVTRLGVKLAGIAALAQIVVQVGFKIFGK